MIKQYEKYRPSGVEWIGEIPSHWEVNRMKYLAEINPPKTSNEHNMDFEDEVVFLPMEMVSENGTVNQEIRKQISEINSGFTYFERGDVIVAKITPCFENGKGALLEDLETNIGFGSTEFHVLRANIAINNHYLYYQVKTDRFKKLGEAHMTGSAGQKRIPSNFIENFIIAVPPIKEQVIIANFLDEKIILIDSFISNKQELIKLLKEERAAIINEAVSGKGKKWMRKKLKYVAKLKSGEGITADDIRPEGEYPVYGGNGLRGYTSSYTHEGDYVLIGRQGALCGNINYASGKFYASEHAVVVNILNGSEVIWLGELLRNMNLNQYSIASAQPGLSVERIQNLSIPVPSRYEQITIVSLIQTETQKINNTIFKIEKEIELMQEYRTALISEVLTGKIKVI